MPERSQESWKVDPVLLSLENITFSTRTHEYFYYFFFSP